MYTGTSTLEAMKTALFNLARMPPVTSCFSSTSICMPELPPPVTPMTSPAEFTPNSSTSRASVGNTRRACSEPLTCSSKLATMSVGKRRRAWRGWARCDGVPAVPRLSHNSALLCQYLYLCTSKARKPRTCGAGGLSYTPATSVMNPTAEGARRRASSSIIVSPECEAAFRWKLSVCVRLYKY